jgi:hypothetical protein
VETVWVVPEPPNIWADSSRTSPVPGSREYSGYTPTMAVGLGQVPTLRPWGARILSWKSYWLSRVSAAVCGGASWTTSRNRCEATSLPEGAFTTPDASIV